MSAADTIPALTRIAAIQSIIRGTTTVGGRLGAVAPSPGFTDALDAATSTVGAPSAPAAVSSPVAPSSAISSTPTAMPDTGYDFAASGDEVPAGVPYAELFTAAGRANGVSPKLLAAIGWNESRYQPGVVSPAGAQGLMQLMPGTASALGVTDAFDPAQAIDGAARLLAAHHQHYGSWDLALSAYAVGSGTVDRSGRTVPASARAWVDRMQALSQVGR